MGSLQEEYALLLHRAEYAELHIARGVLEDAGTPCLMEAPNEYPEDAVATPAYRFGNRYVPNEARDQSIAALDEASGDKVGGHWVGIRVVNSDGGCVPLSARYGRQAEPDNHDRATDMATVYPNQNANRR